MAVTRQRYSWEDYQVPPVFGEQPEFDAFGMVPPVADDGVPPVYQYQPDNEDRPPVGTAGLAMPAPEPPPDPYGLGALADRLAPADQGPVSLGEGITNTVTGGLGANTALDRAVTGARALEASPVGQGVEAVGRVFMNPVGSALEAVDPELQRRYEAGARPISKTIAGAGSMGIQAVTNPQRVPEMFGELAQAAKQAAAGDVLAGVGMARRAYDKYSIPVATGFLEVFSDPENIAASIGPLAAATDVSKIWQGARAIDDAMRAGVAGEADEAVRALRGRPALNPASEAGQVRLGGLADDADNLTPQTPGAPEPPTGATSGGAAPPVEPPTPRLPADLPGPDSPGHVSPSVEPNVLGLRPISTGLTRRDRIANAFKETLGIGTPAEAHATPAFRERARVQPIIDSQSAAVSAQADEAVRGAFPTRDAAGRIPSLADEVFVNGPTVQDVAARLPNYWQRLTPAQRQAMTWLQETIAPYRELWEQVGARKIAGRADIIDGGFYLPRGRADLEGVDEAAKVFSGPTRRGRAGFEKSATFDSMAEGIDNGYEYSPFRDSIRAYIKDAGTRIADRHVANYLKAATDDAGVKLASTVADRIDPRLHNAVQVLRAKIAGRRETLLRRTLYVKYAHLDAERQAKAVTAELERTLKAGEHAEFLRQTKWAGSTEKEIAQAAAEMKALQSATMRQGRRADVRTGMMIAGDERRADTLAELRQFQAEMADLSGRWKRAQEQARSTPRGMGQVGLVELQGTAFPDELANAANKVLQSEGPATGNLSALPKAVAAVNSLIRGLRSTGEMSYLGIQGLLGLAKDQKAYSKALSVATRAWGIEGDRTLGKFLQEFDAKALADNLPDSAAWTRNGTHIGGASTEYTVGAGLAGKAGDMLQNAPIIRQANRAFGYFGDTLRTQWAQDELRTVMHRTGKAWQQLEAEGEMQRIAEAVNRGTGWTSDRAAGELGDLVLFAPRFFQARLETLGKGVQGMRPYAPLDQAIARDSILKLVGGAALLTYAANAARGKETDWRPWTYDSEGNAKRNPNFFRVLDVAGRDWSLLGTYDTLAAAIIDTATGNPTRALRGMASPVLADAWDIISGKDYSGKPTTDTPEHFAEWLARSHTPFITTGMGDVGKAIDQGNYAQAGGAAGLAFVGGKGSPLSYTDVKENLSQAKFGKAYGDLNREQRAEVTAATELQDRQREFLPDDTGTPEQRTAMMFERRTVQLADLEKNLRNKIERGVAGEELADEIKAFKMLRYQVNQDFLTPEVLAEMERTKSKALEDIFTDEYLNFDLDHKGDGELDFEGRERHRISVLERAKAAGVDPDYIIRNSKAKYDDPVVKKTIMEYDADMEKLRPYYNILDDVDRSIRGFAAAKAEVERAGGKTAYGQQWAMTPIGSPADKHAAAVMFAYEQGTFQVEMAREKMRGNKATGIDAIGQKWLGWQPFKPRTGLAPMAPMMPLRPLPALAPLQPVGAR